MRSGDAQPAGSRAIADQVPATRYARNVAKRSVSDRVAQVITVAVPIVSVVVASWGCDRYNSGDIHRRERHIQVQNWKVSLALDERCELPPGDPAIPALEDRIRIEFAIACGTPVSVEKVVASCERGMDHWLFCDWAVWALPPEDRLYACARPVRDDSEPCRRMPTPQR
jgi:hypothetical protein